MPKGGGAVGSERPRRMHRAGLKLWGISFQPRESTSCGSAQIMSQVARRS